MSVRTQAEVAHDTDMLAALKDVSFGAWNQSRRFLDGITHTGCTTARQRWWLTTLVVRHRKQLKPQFHGTLHRAQKWLRDNADAGTTTPAPASNATTQRTSPRSTGAPSQRGPVASPRASEVRPGAGSHKGLHPDNRTEPPAQPKLFS